MGLGCRVNLPGNSPVRDLPKVLGNALHCQKLLYLYGKRERKERMSGTGRKTLD